MTAGALLIAGTHSGCGKTTISMGLMRAFRNRGLDVQPWKVGPDYIDPKFHGVAAGRTSRNLDTRLCTEAVVQELYSRQSADLSLIEGVMGLFDGAGPLDQRGSSAHLAKLLGVPVILVVDAHAMARSAAALVAGFSRFDPHLPIAGVILNNVGSAHHAAILEDAVSHYTSVPVIGAIRRDDRMTLNSRHLGLEIPDQDLSCWDDRFDQVAGLLEESLDLGLLLRIAHSAPSLSQPKKTLLPLKGRTPVSLRVGIAQDEAFNFYYQDNLDLFEALGVRLVSFSPIHDEKLPDRLDAIYIGGGYPELHAKSLSENHSMRKSIRQAVWDQIPLLAECGGFMYLCDAIEQEAENHPMVGIFPYTACMRRSLRSLGYCEGTTSEACLFGEPGTVISGHVFHWAELDRQIPKEKALLCLKKGQQTIYDGLQVHQAVGSWVHVHFASNLEMLRSFVRKAGEYHERR